jgi:hypothetical protein
MLVKNKILFVIKFGSFLKIINSQINYKPSKITKIGE